MPIGVVFTRPSASASVLQIAARHGATAAEMLVEVVRQALARCVHVENTQLLHAFAQQCMGHRRARAAGTHLHDALAARPSSHGESLRQTQAIGVVADALAVLEHHGVHRADAAGFRRQFVEQRMIACLHGKVMFSPVKFMRSAACSRSGRALLSSCS
jgi:hypothetical protein